MKEITMYQCSDGSLHNDKKDAEKRDELISKVENALSILKSRDVIENSIGKVEIAVKQNKDDVIYAMSKFMDICKETFRYEIDKELCDKWKEAYRKQDDSVHISHMERLFSDAGIEIFRNAFYRFQCISPVTFIEYSCPIYTKHPYLFDGEMQ